MNICIEVFVWVYVLISLGQISRSGIAGFYGKLMCQKLSHYFPKWLGFYPFLLNRVCVGSSFVFGLHFIILKDVELPFWGGLLAICMFSLLRYLFKSFTLPTFYLVRLSSYWMIRVLYIFWVQVLCHIYNLQIFFFSVMRFCKTNLSPLPNKTKLYFHPFLLNLDKLYVTILGKRLETGIRLFLFSTGDGSPKRLVGL